MTYLLEHCKPYRDLVQKIDYEKLDVYKTITNLDLDREVSKKVRKQEGAKAPGQDVSVQPTGESQADHQKSDHLTDNAQHYRDADLPQYTSIQQKNEMDLDDIFTAVQQQAQTTPEFEKITEKKYRTVFNIEGIVNDSMKNQLILSHPHLFTNGQSDVLDKAEELIKSKDIKKRESAWKLIKKLMMKANVKDGRLEYPF